MHPNPIAIYMHMYVMHVPQHIGYSSAMYIH